MEKQIAIIIAAYDDTNSIVNRLCEGFLCTPKIIKGINEVPKYAIDSIFKRPYKPTCSLYVVSSNKAPSGNIWLYVPNGAVTVSLTCNGQRRELVLEYVGIIETDHNYRPCSPRFLRQGK